MEREQAEGPSWAIALLGPPVGGVLVAELDGDLTLYDPSRNEVHLLNATAGDIWRLMDGEHRLDDIVDLIAATYSAGNDEVRPHVERTVSLFVERGLVPVVDGP